MIVMSRIFCYLFLFIFGKVTGKKINKASEEEEGWVEIIAGKE